MTASIKYDPRTHNVSVTRKFSPTKAETKIVKADVLCRIGDCDITNLLHEAMMFPGIEHRLPVIHRIHA